MKSIAIGLMVSLALLGGSTFAAQKQQTITGEVMDSSCAKMGSHEMMEKQHNMPSNAASDKACTLACVKAGAKLVLYDTVVSHVPFTERLLFHELVHVVQYEKVGLPEFAAKYVRGFLTGGSYEAIPLERNAYELDARFAGAPAKPFSVEAEVEAWMRAGRF